MGKIHDAELAQIFLTTGIPDKIVAGHSIDIADWMKFGRACAKGLRVMHLRADGEDVSVEKQGGLFDIHVGAGQIIATQHEAEALLALLQSAIDGYTD